MRVLAIVVRIIRQFFRDKRTLALMIVAPMFVLLLMDLVFNGEEYKPDRHADIVSVRRPVFGERVCP